MNRVPEHYPPMRVTVLGSGTSIGVPVIGCTCPVCTSTDPRNTRLRTSVKIDVAGKTILIDCGVDFRMQMLQRPTARIDAVLLTHTHADHIHGIDDLRTYCFRQEGRIPIYSRVDMLEDVRLRFGYCFNPPQVGGGVPQIDLREIAAGELFEACGIPILPIEIMHGKLRILGYRFGRFAYLTDCSMIPEESFGLLEGVDTWIISALRPKPHPTHFNVEQAMDATRRGGVRRAYFIHMTHDLEHAQTEAELPEWARLTYDGLTIDIEGGD